MRSVRPAARHVPLWSLCALIAFLALVAFPASAQTDEADRLVAEGIELRVQGREVEALKLFRAAVDLTPNSPRARGHLALTLHALEQWVESERVMQDVLRASADDWVLRHATELRKSLDAVQAHLGWLEVDAPVAGELLLDGALVGMVPMSGPTRVVARQYTLTLRSPGRAPIQRVVSVPAGRHYRLSLQYPAPESSAAQKVADSPKPARAAVPPPPPPTAGKTTGLGMAMLGVGTASLIAGIYFGMNAILLKEKRDRECTPDTGCSANGIAFDARGRDSANFANISFAIGVAGMGVGAVLVW